MLWLGPIPYPSLKQQPNKKEDMLRFLGKSTQRWAKPQQFDSNSGTVLRFFRNQHHLHNKAAAHWGIVGHLGGETNERGRFQTSPAARG
jgi:hypothetical protein